MLAWRRNKKHRRTLMKGIVKLDAWRCHRFHSHADTCSSETVASWRTGNRSVMKVLFCFEHVFFSFATRNYKHLSNFPESKTTTKNLKNLIESLRILRMQNRAAWFCTGSICFFEALRHAPVHSQWAPQQWAPGWGGVGSHLTTGNGPRFSTKNTRF